MDEAVQRFRRHAHRELGDRHGTERRYSVALRQEAVTYWEARARAGDGLRTVAARLQVAPVSLRRWAADRRVQPVTIVPDPALAPMGVAVIIEADRVRVEGLDVETAAQLIARLR